MHVRRSKNASVPSILGIAMLLAITSPAAAQDDSQAGATADMAAEAVGVGRGAGARPMLRRAPPPVVADAELARALEDARPEIRGCLEQRQTGRAQSAVVRARIDRQHRLTLVVRVRPSDSATQACIDLATRRHVQPLQSRPISRTISATLRESVGDVLPPPRPPVPPPPPPFHPPNGRYDESEVHAALDAMRASMIECVSDLPRGMPGEITMRVTVHPDGSMTLVGVQLPTGVRGPGSLGCLSSRVRMLRVSPPPGDRMVVHALRL